MAIFTLCCTLDWLALSSVRLFGMCRIHLSLFCEYTRKTHYTARRCHWCLENVFVHASRIIGIQVNAHTFIIIIFHSIYCLWWWRWVSKRKRIVSCENFISFMPTLLSTVCARLCSVLGWFGTQHGRFLAINVREKFSERRKHKRGIKGQFFGQKIK